jgi:hypothetical protein
VFVTPDPIQEWDAWVSRKPSDTEALVVDLVVQHRIKTGDDLSVESMLVMQPAETHDDLRAAIGIAIQERLVAEGHGPFGKTLHLTALGLLKSSEGAKAARVANAYTKLFNEKVRDSNGNPGQLTFSDLTGAEVCLSQDFGLMVAVVEEFDLASGSSKDFDLVPFRWTVSLRCLNS